MKSITYIFPLVLAFKDSLIIEFMGFTSRLILAQSPWHMLHPTLVLFNTQNSNRIRLAVCNVVIPDNYKLSGDLFPVPQQEAGHCSI